MFEITPAELRKVIREVQQYNLVVSHELEFHEASVSSAPSYIRPVLLSELAYIKQTVRQVLQNIRGNVAVLEKILQEDEIANGWQGENRHIKFMSEEDYKQEGGFQERESEFGYSNNDYDDDDDDDGGYKDYNDSDEDDDDNEY